jgi:hypothetical protein
MATKTVTQQAIVAVELIPWRTIVGKPIEASERATIFDVFNNSNAQTNRQIEKIMRDSGILINVPQNTKTVSEHDLAGGWNTLLLGKNHQDVYFSGSAIADIRKGFSVKLHYTELSSLEVSSHDPNLDRHVFVAVVGSNAEQSEASSNMAFSCSGAVVTELTRLYIEKLQSAGRLERRARLLRDEAENLRITIEEEKAAGLLRK